MNILGIHHVSAMTKKAQQNVDFYTTILGMRMVKKTVNQDDPSMYHLFYGDEVGNPGTELTFFEIPQIGQNHNGNHSISTTSLRVPDDEALEYWRDRLTAYEVDHDGIQEAFGRHVLPFRDHEHQRLMLVSDEGEHGVASGTPWEHSKAKREYGITGLGPIHLTVPKVDWLESIIVDVLGFTFIGDYNDQKARTVHVYSVEEGGTGAEIHVHERFDLPPERLGRGGVHHVAFRVADEQELQQWIDLLNQNEVGNSGFVDRHYFKAVYFREPNGILFELATDGPGFATDEDMEHLGESLALPPFLEDKRTQIESILEPIHL
ncbi:glyoxalase family protein [Alkalibacillus flavidus]|uniref:Glyoxalase family protein n=1 Tax=Alkalibacillus flavidus TaxID=546021 RepID=A0ABV2KWB4_9BACI